MNEPAPGRIPFPVLLAYVLPAFVVALPTIPVYIQLPALYGAELGLGLAVTGYILFGARIFDTVTDPLAGVLSDHFGYRGSRRKPWIAIGTVIAAIGLYKILNPPTTVDGSYLFGWSIVLYGGWTLVAVPYMAWGAELSIDYDERTRITSWREGFALLGIAGAGILMAATSNAGWDERQSIGILAWGAIAMGAVAFPILLWKVPDVAPPGGASDRFDLRRFPAGVRSLASNGPFVRLLSAWFLNGFANGIPAALFYIYLEYALGAGPTQRSVFVLVYFVAAIAAIPLWLVLSRRYGKHPIWCWSMLIACAAFASVPLIDEGAFVAFAVVCVVTGMALGADLALPPAIQADVVDYDELRTGKARAGLQFALWTMVTKFALAAAVGLALAGVEWAGFDPDDMTDRGRWALVGTYALLPIGIKLSAIIVVWRFPLTAERHAVIRRRLSRIRARGGPLHEKTR